MLKDKKVLVTGGAGFIGSHLVNELEKYDCEIIVFDNFSSGHIGNTNSFGERVKVINGDLRDISKIKEACQGINYVFHLAAMPFIPDCYKDAEGFITSNINGTFNLLNSILDQNITCFVNISTSEIYGSALYVPMDEKHPTLPHSTYAASKLAAENIVYTMHKEHGFPIKIIRCFNTFGPRDSHPRIIPEIIKQFVKNKELKLGNINSTRDMLYVKDTAKGLIKAALSDKSNGEIINLGTGVETPINSLIPIIQQILGAEFLPVTIEQDRLRPLDVDRLCADNNKAKLLLEWQPEYSLESGLRETIEWYKKEGSWVWEK